MGVTGSVLVDVFAGFSFGMEMRVGLDTNGFYVQDDDRKGLYLTGELGARPVFLVGVGADQLSFDFASVTGEVFVRATGAIDLKIPESELATHADGKIRGSDMWQDKSLQLEYVDLSLVLDLVWTLQGSIFIQGTDMAKRPSSTRIRMSSGDSKLVPRNYQSLTLGRWRQKCASGLILSGCAAS